MILCKIIIIITQTICLKVGQHEIVGGKITNNALFLYSESDRVLIRLIGLNLRTTFVFVVIVLNIQEMSKPVLDSEPLKKPWDLGDYEESGDESNSDNEYSFLCEADLIVTPIRVLLNKLKH